MQKVDFKSQNMKILITSKIIVDPETEPRVFSDEKLMQTARKVIDPIDDANVQS